MEQVMDDTPEPFTQARILAAIDHMGDAIDRALSSSLFLAAIFIVGAVGIAAVVLIPLSWGRP